MTLFDPDSRAAPEGAPLARPDGSDTVRLRLLVAYDGTNFHGFAENRDVRTVAGVLRQALETVLRHPVTLTGAGRTDAGVHAWGQVVSLDVPAEGLDLVRLQRSVNALAAPDVVVREVSVASPDFDARFSALWRRYRYSVLTSPWADPLRRATTWHVGRPLSLDSLRLACDPFIGEHDFSSFCRSPKDDEGAPMVRRVLAASWTDLGDGHLGFEITATAFCQQMVRSIVGTMVEIGFGRRHAGEILGMLRARNRAVAGQVAPPHGLCLWEVGYP
ncbi:MAG TPA: tRNA pseudouridine(38-40) synthase TruA [Acidimicrobiales bacterium]